MFVYRSFAVKLFALGCIVGIFITVCIISLCSNFFEEMQMTPLALRGRDSGKINVLVVGYGRGGSTFTYKLMQACPLTFGVYEPFFAFLYGGNLSRKPDLQHGIKWNAANAVGILEDIFSCNFNDIAYIFKDHFDHQMNMMKLLRNYWPILQDFPDFVNKICQMSTLTLVKTIRIDFDVVEQLYESFPSGSPLKVIHLVRDPRGIVSSRKSNRAFNNIQSTDHRLLCTRMRKNIEFFTDLQKKHPHDFIQIKYENWARGTHVKVKDLFRFIGVDSELLIDRNFIDKLLDYDGYDASNYSLRYNTWKKNLDANLILEIEDDCRDVMKMLQYGALATQ